MDKQHLREQLRNLHEELGRADSVDEESRRLLRELAEDIRTIIDEPLPENHKDECERTQKEKHEPLLSFRAKLQDSAREIEVRHPALTEVINRILDALPK